MAKCNICGKNSFRSYQVEFNKAVCKECMQKAGLLLPLGIVDMKKAIQLCGGKPTVDKIKMAMNNKSIMSKAIKTYTSSDITTEMFISTYKPNISKIMGELDPLFFEAGELIIKNDKASIGMLQRWFKIGFNRAARVMDQLADMNVVGEELGTKPREINMAIEDFIFLKENYKEIVMLYKNGELSGEGKTFLKDENDAFTMNMVDNMDGHSFEHFCAELLRKNGFVNVSVTPGSGDQGVDVLAVKDGIKYAIQCKNYASPLGNTPVQEVSAGKTFYHCHVAVVLTNSVFTEGAKQLAEATGVLLWDRKKLDELMNVLKKDDDVIGEVEIDSETETVPVVINTSPVLKEQNEKKNSEKSVAVVKETIEKHKSVTETIDGVKIEIDEFSAQHFGINFENFGLEKDDPDLLEFLFDIVIKDSRLVHWEFVTIVCNLYVGVRKVATEIEIVDKEDFCNRDSRYIYFEKKDICENATKIEVFCKK